ncbi:MAG: hypothetical protein ABF285_09005 [Pacificibacter sp.]|uniref:hypothetical protein n=1 Tax=Pacificibacter sp. TaxID=1917866 RepID=UPI00321912C1
MMGLSRASFVASVAFAALSGCMADGDAMEVTRNGFKFNVSVDGTTAVARNFHTGQLNFAVLEESARAAIEAASGCTVRTLTKRGEINTFDATLNCAG